MSTQTQRQVPKIALLISIFFIVLLEQMLLGAAVVGDGVTIGAAVVGVPVASTVGNLVVGPMETTGSAVVGKSVIASGESLVGAALLHFPSPGWHCLNTAGSKNAQ